MSAFIAIANSLLVARLNSWCMSPLGCIIICCGKVIEKSYVPFVIAAFILRQPALYGFPW